MIIPPNDADTLHNAIPGSVTDGQGNYAFPCSTDADIALVFGGTSFSISPKDYVGSPLSGTSNLCQSNIVGQQIGGPTQWLSGDVFLKNVYTVFDFDNNQIGFGSKTTNTTASQAAATGQTLIATSTSSMSTSASDSEATSGGERIGFGLVQRTLIGALASIVLSVVLLI
jgi:cathepsin D